MDWWALTTSGLLRDPVCHEGDWEEVRPWPRTLLVGGGPDGAVTAHRSKKQAKKKYISPLMAGALLFAKVSKANHMASKVPNGFDTETSRVQRGHQAGVLLVDCHPNNFQNNLHPRCPKHAQSLSLPTPPLEIPG